jgi:hypothetical protein
MAEDTDGAPTEVQDTGTGTAADGGVAPETGTETGAGVATDAATAADTVDGSDATDPSNLLADFQLHHPRWHRWLYVVLPAAAVLQWLLVIPLAIRNDVLTSTSPGFDPLRDELVAGVEPTGFFNDYFFIVWNLFPIALWAVYVAADQLGRQWIRDVAPRIDTTEAADSIRKLRAVRDHWAPSLLFLGGGVAALAAQIPKQLGFFDTHAQLYWWDWRVSPPIFVIRDLALFTNLVLILLVFWGTLFGLLIVIQSVREGAIEPDYFHPDDAGGLLPIGNAMSILILPWILGAFLGVLGFFDHTTASELLFRVGDVFLVVVCTVIAATLFAYPLYTIRTKISRELDQVKENVHSLADQHRLSRDLAGTDAAELSDTHPTDHELTDAASVILIYRRLDNISGWPISSGRVYQVVLLLASPGITVLTQFINTFIRTYWF